MQKCGVCGNEFATDKALSQHMRDKHGTSLSEANAASGTSPAPEQKSRPKSLRKKNRHPVAISLAVVAIVLGIGMYYVVAPTFTQFPFPCGEEGSYMHIHPYLRIVVDGQDVTVPGNIGLCSGGSFEPMHTHDSSGIIHIETSTYQNFTLGQFFSIWKATFHTANFNGSEHPVEFNSTDILGLKADATHQIELLVDGQNSSAWENLVLDTLDYCSASTTTTPCSPTAVGNPSWRGSTGYPFGTGHTIVIEYCSGQCPP
ncbi:MAG: hypothetical protein HY296_00610 [Thaumarchaeota archaeon]|nr:hypothetical protein [Nitrososphaerota archaeon]